MRTAEADDETTGLLPLELDIEGGHVLGRNLSTAMIPVAMRAVPVARTTAVTWDSSESGPPVSQFVVKPSRSSSTAVSTKPSSAGLMTLRRIRDRPSASDPPISGQPRYTLPSSSQWRLVDCALSRRAP